MFIKRENGISVFIKSTSAYTYFINCILNGFFSFALKKILNFHNFYKNFRKNTFIDYVKLFVIFHIHPPVHTLKTFVPNTRNISHSLYFCNTQYLNSSKDIIYLSALLLISASLDAEYSSKTPITSAPDFFAPSKA